MKKVIYSCLFFGILACSGTYELDLPAVEKIVFCSCLFSPDTTWEAELGYTYVYAIASYDSWIENAKVRIISETNDTIELEHYRKGKYRNGNQKPERGMKYRIQAVVGSDSVYSGESSIPLNVDFSVTNFDENPGLVQYGFFTMNDVYDVEINVGISEPGIKKVLIRALLFDSIRSSPQYTFNNAVFDSILHIVHDQELVNKITFLNGDTIYGSDNLLNQLLLIFGDELSFQQTDAIRKVSYIGDTDERKEEAFTKIQCLSSSPHFLNFDYEDYSLLGSFDVSENFHAYVWDFLEGEYWFQCKALSEEAYQYYKSYIAQLSNRTDYNSLCEPVYSNIKNGTGIFAGYSEQMIKLN